jgi:uncharacterized protein YbjT (DUF2867 family)
MTEAVSKRFLVLLTGATGYVGGRLLGALLNKEVRMRCLVRRPEHLQLRAANAELIRGDVLDRDSLEAAFEGVSTAYYLIHSMGPESYEEKDRHSAINLAEAARGAGVRRIIYLGGLGAAKTSRRIFAAATKWAICCASRACRLSNSPHLSLSDLAACHLK